MCLPVGWCCRALPVAVFVKCRVTETDRSNEALIQRGLKQAFPEDRFLGEVRLLFVFLFLFLFFFSLFRFLFLLLLLLMLLLL